MKTKAILFSLFFFVLAFMLKDFISPAFGIPRTMITLAKEGEKFQIINPVNVWYGVDGVESLSVRKRLSGALVCNSQTFDKDPAPGQTKICQVSSNNKYPGTAVMSWDASVSEGVTEYKVYMSTTAGAYSTGFSAGLQTTFGIGGISPKQTLYFTTKAFDAAGEGSGPSNEVSKVIP